MWCALGKWPYKRRREKKVEEEYVNRSMRCPLGSTLSLLVLMFPFALGGMSSSPLPFSPLSLSPCPPQPSYNPGVTCAWDHMVQLPSFPVFGPAGSFISLSLSPHAHILFTMLLIHIYVLPITTSDDSCILHLISEEVTALHTSCLET